MGKWLVLAVIAGCATNASAPAPHVETPPPNIFVNVVYPILRQGCTGNTSGCHTAVQPGFQIDPAFGPDAATAYRNTLLYTGDFTANAPLLTYHPMNQMSLGPDQYGEIEMWFAQEREDRGL